MADVDERRYRANLLSSNPEVWRHWQQSSASLLGDFDQIIRQKLG